MVKWPAFACTRWPSSSFVVPHVVLVTCRRPCTQNTSSTTAYQMDTIKRKYNKAKGKVKDLLRPPSRQSASTTPAPSPRNSQDPASAVDREIPTTSSAIVPVSQTAIALTAIDAPSADVPSLEVSASEPSHQPKHAPDPLTTYAQPPSTTSRLATMASICNDLVTVVHGASDAFPPLKSALGGILEIWKQCEVRLLLP